MKILLDTQMLIWVTTLPELLPKKARQLLADPEVLTGVFYRYP